MTSITSITSRELLALVLPYQPVVDGNELAFNLELPDELVAPLTVLHAGVRAPLTHRRWWGCATDHLWPTVFILDPDGVLPARTKLLCVEGDATWDRIHPDVPIDLPQLFDHTDARRKTG